MKRSMGSVCILGVLFGIGFGDAGCSSKKASSDESGGAAENGGDGGKVATGGATTADGGKTSGGGTTGNAGGSANNTVGGTTDTSPPSGPAIEISPVSGLKVPEAAGTGTFTVKLATKPTANVTIALTNSATADAKLDVNELVFTPDDYGLAKTVTISGIDDQFDDGDTPFVIITAPATSTDSSYSGMNADNVEGTVIDDDRSFVLIGGGVGLSTSETGTSASFTVVLTSRPKATVSIPLSVSDDTEAALTRSSLIFTENNWDVPQSVSVLGLDDTISDGTVAYSVVLGKVESEDSGYKGLDPEDIALLNVDNDSPGFVVSPTSLNTTESGGQAFFTVTLTVAPKADVTIPITSSKTSEGTVAPATLTFTPSNWSTAQTVKVTGQDDPLVDGSVTFTIVTGQSTSADPGYTGLDPVDVTVVNADNDVASIQVTPTSGLQTSETGTTATFTVVLGAQPSGPVSIGVKSSDVSEGTVSPSTLTFTSANWNTPQTVTVTGVNDDANDSSVIYTIETTTASSTDPAYSGFAVPDVTVTNLDDEEISPVMIVSPTSGLSTTEAGGTATFTLRLSSAPLASVGVSVTSSDATEASVAPSTLIFSSTNWNVPQSVTVTGLDDGIDDGDIAYTLITSSTVSADPNYSGLDVPDVAATNVDNDKVGIIVSAKDILQTTETGGTATFTVVLACQPSSPVVIPLSSTDATEGAVSPASLSFTTANWNVPQTVTITGMNDVLDDNDVGYSIITGAASSLDPAYSGLDATDVIVINVDNDPVVPCADPLMIDDVEDGDLTICGNGGRVGTWYTNDSSTLVTPSLGGLPAVRSDSSVCMETAASGSTTWATLGFTLKGTSVATRLPYDISAYTGLRFWARRGAASSYPSSVIVQLIQTNTTTVAEGGTCNTSVYECSDHYAYGVSVSTAWAEYQLPFTSFYQSSTWGSYFPRDLTSVLAIEFLLKNTSSYDLQVDDVRFY
jgi:hypothetical protein